MLIRVISGVVFAIAHQHIIIDVLRRLTVLSFCQRHAVGIGIRAAVGKQRCSCKVEESTALATRTLARPHYSRLVDQAGRMIASGQRDVSKLHRHEARIAACGKAAERALAVVVVTSGMSCRSGILHLACYILILIQHVTRRTLPVAVIIPVSTPIVSRSCCRITIIIYMLCLPSNKLRHHLDDHEQVTDTRCCSTFVFSIIEDGAHLILIAFMEVDFAVSA